MSDSGTRKVSNNTVTDKDMSSLFALTVRDLIHTISNGEASPQDRATAARICKENGVGMEIEWDEPDEPAELGLPEFDD